MAKKPPPVGPKDLVVSHAAQADLRDITEHLLDVADLETANRLSDKLNAALEKLARLGHAGVPKDILSPGLRLQVAGNYNIYFRVTDTETRIIRVLHGARDLESIDFDA